VVGQPEHSRQPGNGRADRARDWLTIFQLPPYAHELNPVELVWSHLKRSLANLAKRNLAQLIALARTRLKRMQYRPALLDGFLASTGLDLTPFGPPPLRIVSQAGRRLPYRMLTGAHSCRSWERS
jgi:DDE superfamily endonuclease